MAAVSVWRSKKTRRQLGWALAFISPWILGFLFFITYPALASLYYGFTSFSIVKDPRWVGLDNYTKLLTNDPLFYQTIANTLYMVVLGVPVSIVFAFVTALLLDVKVRGLAVYRTIYYLPTVVPPVAATLLWLWIFNPQYGLLNYLLGFIGLRSPTWFNDPDWSKPALIIMGLWAVGGTTVLYLAALKGVPAEMYEAATLDGAGWWQRTWRITIPLVSPVTLFVVIVGVINAFRIFDTVYIIGGTSNPTAGKPQGSLLFYGLYLYANAFTYLKMGYASAMAWVLFLIILAVTVVLIKSSNRWTHYEI
jgi:multiple sugar transport system permease protein